jgi:phage replication-related protein YjqB (UPF0714/DUF867 family)
VKNVKNNYIKLIALVILITVLFSSCNDNETSNKNSSDELHQTSYAFNEDWVENSFTQQLPRPDFKTSFEEKNEDELIIHCDATDKQFKKYIEEIKSSGFSKDVSEKSEKAFGINAYSFSAKNDNGYSVRAEYSDMLGISAKITVKNVA